MSTLTEAGVSSREAEVLELLGENLTNAQISARLYISVRTVESHVSSLLRKLRVVDRRALGHLAEGLRRRAGQSATISPPATTPAGLPAPLTSFVGREAERSALAAELAGRRLVTAVGPGGVGKTRLALAVASDLTDRFADGVWYVDLVPVTDPAMIAAAVAAALGVGDQSGRSLEDTLLTHLEAADALVVLDNCEHLVDGVVVFAERLLAACPHVTALVTSQARLLVPFERVFPVTGLSLPAADDGASSAIGDAAALFVERATAVGAPPSGPDDLRRIAAICTRLEGMALAIELAAARLPTLGLDGLEAGLADQLQTLAGRARVDDRHSSLRSTLDWSYALLTSSEQTVLRRVAVFAAPFTVDRAAQVAGFPPIDPATVAPILASLADHSLLEVLPNSGATSYRALGTIRQYGTAAMDEVGEVAGARRRHLRWCLDAARRLSSRLVEAGWAELPADWRLVFDGVADDLRAALGWVTDEPTLRAEAHELAMLVAALTYARGLSGEGQRRFEQAAELALDDEARATALRRAAGAAQSRHLGDEAMRFNRAAAAAALRAGDPATAAFALAAAAALAYRFPGALAHVPAASEADALLQQAQRMAVVTRSPALDATLITVEVFRGDERDPLTGLLAERAVELSRRVDDPVVQSAALDGLTGVQLGIGENLAAAASTRARVELLTPLPPTADTGFELTDALQMASETSVAVGNLHDARRYGDEILELPLFRDEGHLATPRLLVVEALAGNWDRVMVLSQRFRDEWQRAGSPPTSNLAFGASAVAMVHGLQGDAAARDEWLSIVASLRAALMARYGTAMPSNPAFDAVVLLHQGETDAAVQLLATAPELFRTWHTGRLRQWYAALWIEAAVLAEQPSLSGRLERARLVVDGNPIATAIVERAAALADGGDPTRLADLSRALDAAGCHYQSARTRVFAGGAAREEGEAALLAMGAAPMALTVAWR